MEMFTCKKYNVSMLAAKADETCAKRFETSLHGHFHNFDKCNTCNRGTVLYEAGKHRASVECGTKQTISETIVTKGDTTVATNAKGACSTVDCGRTVQKEGLCYKCFKAKHGCAPYPGQDGKKKKAAPVKIAKASRQDKTRHSKPSSHPALSRKGRGGKGADGGAVGVSLDFSGYSDLLIDIEAMAEEQFHSVEMQIVFMLNQAMNSKG